jgi:hypothetical protein
MIMPHSTAASGVIIKTPLIAIQANARNRFVYDVNLFNQVSLDILELIALALGWVKASPRWKNFSYPGYLIFELCYRLLANRPDVALAKSVE